MSKFKKFLCSTGGRVAFIALFYIVISVIMAIFITLEVEFVVFILISLFAYFGWKALNKITPNIFLIMPIGGWILYFVIKGVLALLCGMFVAPFVISKSIVNAFQADAVGHNVEE